MARKGEIYIKTVNDLEPRLMSAFGRKVTITDTEISKSERTASGKLCKDIIATPRKIVFNFEMIDGDELDYYIESLYETYDELLLIFYTTDQLYDEYTCLMEPISRERILLLGNGLWGNVSVEFNEVSRTV